MEVSKYPIIAKLSQEQVDLQGSASGENKKNIGFL